MVDIGLRNCDGRRSAPEGAVGHWEFEVNGMKSEASPSFYWDGAAEQSLAGTLREVFDGHLILESETAIKLWVESNHSTNRQTQQSPLCTKQSRPKVRVRAGSGGFLCWKSLEREIDKRESSNRRFKSRQNIDSQIAE